MGVEKMVNGDKLTREAPAPFRREYFAFASSHSGTIGSLYFRDAYGIRRIRLCHDDGPEVNEPRPGREWFFPLDVSEDSLPYDPHSMEDVNEWAQSGGVPTVPTEGRSIVEYWPILGGVKRHISRGVVVIPQINQHDINVIYNVIKGGCDNQTLKQAIIDNNLSAVLRQ